MISCVDLSMLLFCITENWVFKQSLQICSFMQNNTSQPNSLITNYITILNNFWRVFLLIKTCFYVAIAENRIFRHIQNPGIFRTLVYSDAWYIQMSGILRTLTYLEPWYIQKPDIFRTLAYSELWHIQNQSHIQNPGIFRTSNIFTSLCKIPFCTIVKYGKVQPLRDRSQ